MILGTAGHIDHGKTALVKALTGVDADRLPEEKRRGITIDLGFAPLEIEDVGTIGIVDVPGHEGFVRTMLAGASGIDLAMLVIAADEGIMPQTREHLEILTLLEIPRGVIALTKCDLAEPDWIDLVIDDVRALCIGTPLEKAEIVRVSSVTGQNIEELRNAIGRAAKQQTSFRENDVFRMPVDRAFSVHGTGTVVTGTVWSGIVEKDAAVRIEPGGKTARVRAIQSHGLSHAKTSPGTRTALALAGCEVADVPRGTSIVVDKSWAPTREIEVALSIVDDEFTPTPRTRVRFFLATSDTGGRLSRLRQVEGKLRARIILDEPVVARARDRFVIRVPSPAKTVGGGEVIDPYPPRRARSDERVIDPDDVDTRLERILEQAWNQGVVVDSLPIRVGFPPHVFEESILRVEAFVVADRVLSSTAMHDLENVIESFVVIHSANHPLEAGVSLQTVRMTTRAPHPIVDAALENLKKKNRIELTGALLRPAGWSSKLDAREQGISDSILHDICNRPDEPPSVDELEKKFGKSTRALLRRLERHGDVERVSEDRYYSRDAVIHLVGTLRRLETGRNYSPAELKEVLGVTRKYLIPFLEFCDRTGVTERGSDGRKVKAVVVAGKDERRVGSTQYTA